MAIRKKPKTALKKATKSKTTKPASKSKKVVFIVDEKKVKAVAKRIIKYAKANSRITKRSDKYPLWYAGISNNPNIRKVGHKKKLAVDDLPTFKAFDAETYVNARAVEIYLCDNHKFQHCKLEGKPNKDGHKSPSRYTYIYFIPPNLRKK